MTIQTPLTGSCLQLVGVTAAEVDRMLASTTQAVLDEQQPTNPLLVTDPARATPAG